MIYTGSCRPSLLNAGQLYDNFLVNSKGASRNHQSLQRPVKRSTDTFSVHTHLSPGFYARQGYVECARMRDYVPGQDLITMEKRGLVDRAPA